MDIEKERKAFEAIPRNARLLRGAIFKDGEYVALSLFDESSKELAAQLNYGWSMWQAAKAQAVPEVLKKFCNEHKDPAWRGRLTEYDKGYSDCCIAVLEMIEAQEQSHE